MKSKHRKYLFVTMIILFYFIIAHTSIFKQDDFRWGTNSGLERLSKNFDDYNGRYFGNYIIIALTRSRVVQAILPTIINTGIVLLIYKLFDKKINLSIVMLFVLTLPFNVYRQTYGWLSGFANYNTAIFLILLIAYLIHKESLDIKNYVFLIIASFSVQLFLENTSAVNIVIATLFLIYSIFNKAYIKKSIALFIPNLIGTIVMFSNTAYLPDAGSRSLSNISFKMMPFSFLGKWGEMFFKENFILLFLLLIGLYLISSDEIKYIKYTIFPIPIYFLLRYQLNADWESIPTKLLYIEGALILLFILITFYLVYKSNVLTSTMKQKFTLFFTLSGLYSGPFLILKHPYPHKVISYINYRNILGTYILLIVAILYLYLPFIKSNRPGIKKIKKVIPLVAASIMITISSMSAVDYIFDRTRIADAKTKIENGQTSIDLERLPFDELHFPWNISETSEFNSDFKKYYDFPENIEFNEVSLRNKYTDD